MGWNSVQVVAGCECAVDTHANQFPASWRDGADNFWGMVLPEYTGQSSLKTGKDLLIEALKSHELTFVEQLQQLGILLKDEKDGTVSYSFE